MHVNHSVISHSNGTADAKYTLVNISDEEYSEVNRFVGNMEHDKEDVSNNETTDMVDHPSHYNQSSMECIDEMILVFGKKAVADFCLCNVWKYRNRAPYKGNPPQDAKKADWYMTKYKELIEDIDKSTSYTTSLNNSITGLDKSSLIYKK